MVFSSILRRLVRRATDPATGRPEVYFNTASETVRALVGGSYEDVGGGGGGAASYLVYSALLTQTGTDAPTATILENTLGGVPVWTRNTAGVYTATLAGVFTVDKTFISSATVYRGAEATGTVSPVANVNANEVVIRTHEIIASFGSQELADAVLNKTPVEIRVYPS